MITAADDRDAAELSVLSAVLEEQTGLETFEDVAAEVHLQPSDFYSPRHEMIWAAIADLVSAGRRPDAIAVSGKLREDKTLEQCGGYPYFAVVALAQGHRATAVSHAQLIRDRATMRKLAAAGAHVAHLSGTESDDLVTVIDQAQSAVAAVADRIHGPSDQDDMQQVWDDILDSIGANTTPAVPTGLRVLDNHLAGGLVRESLTTVAARPGHGKTVFGLQVAAHVGLQGGNVGFTSLEMSRNDLGHRALSALSSVDYGRIQRADRRPLNEDEDLKLRKARERFRDSALELSSRTNGTAEDIRADIRSMIRRRGTCDLWVVDYLQLLSPTDRKAMREQQVAHMTRTLKNTARETGTPIILLAQLNREGVKDKREPIITDLRESGSIEQDSDNVLLLHKYGTSEAVLKIIVAKNRRGPLGQADNLWFDGAHQRILDPRDVPQAPGLYSQPGFDEMEN